MSAVRDRRGASSIEFALLLPVLTTMVAGVIDLGWYLHQAQMAAQAVREGAHVGSMIALDGTPSPADAAEGRTRGALERMGLDSALATIDVRYEDLLDLGACNTDDTLFVTMEIPFSPAIGLVPLRPTIRSELATLLLYSDCME